MRKNMVALGLVLVSILSAVSQSVAAEPAPISIELNEIPLKTDVPPIIINNRTMVPVRAVSEALGAYVEWAGPSRAVLVYNYNANALLVLTIGKTDFETIGETPKLSVLDVAPTIIDSRTLVPLRLVSEFLGLLVKWDEGARTVMLTGKIYSGPKTLASSFDVWAFPYRFPEEYAARTAAAQAAAQATEAEKAAQRAILRREMATYVRSGNLGMAVIGGIPWPNISGVPAYGWLVVRVEMKNYGNTVQHVNPQTFTASTSDGVTFPLSNRTYYYTDRFQAVDLPPGGTTFGWLIFDIYLESTHYLNYSLGAVSMKKTVHIYAFQ